MRGTVIRYGSDMSEPYFTTEDLQQVQSDLKAANMLVAQLQNRRDQIMCELHANGMTGRAVSLLVEMTEGRVYQILRSGPGASLGWFGGLEARFVTDADGEPVRAFILAPNDEDTTQDHVEEIDL